MLLTAQILPLQAQVSASIVDRNVSENSTAFSSQRKIVRDTNGELFVVYLKPIQNMSEVFLSRSQDEGRTWSEIGQVSEGNYQSVRASIAIDAANRVYVFWTKFIGEYGQIFYRTYDNTGWSNEYQLTSGDAYSGYPSACFDANGRIDLVWYGFDGTAYQVYFGSYDGKAWSSPVKLSQGYPDSVNPTVIVDSKNNIHVAWFKSNGRNYQINYVEWTGSWGRQMVLSPALTDAYNPTMAINSKGQIYVVWDEGKGPLTQIYYSISDGGIWSGQVALTTGVSAQNPSVAIDSQDKVYVFYEKSDGQIYNRIYDQSWSAEQTLTYSGLNTFPSVRWSYHNNPQNGSSGKVDFVWSSKEAGLQTVKYGGLSINESQKTEQPVVSGGANGSVITILATIGFIFLLSTVFLIDRRRVNARAYT